MLPFKKILCPTDFSEPSYEAIKAAGELAYHFGSELCIIHVVSPVPLMPMGVEPTAFNVILYEEELMVSSKKSLEEVLNHLETKEVKARLIAVRGDAVDEIVRIADEEKIDLIVIATRGRTGLDRLIFGSVTEKVVRLAKCPVLTVTGEPSAEVGKEIILEKGGEAETPEEKSEKRKTYQEKVEDQLKEWGVKIDELMAKAETSKAEIKIKYLEQVEELKSKQGALKQRLGELKESGDEAWEDFKDGLEDALDEMKKALKRGASRFKKS